MTEEQPNESNGVSHKEWKKCLSGALSDGQIKAAMAVLFIFYFGYTLHNGFLVESKEQDEGSVIRNCSCKESHRTFYIVWLICCGIVWSIFHLLLFAINSFSSVKKLYDKSYYKLRDSLWDTVLEIHRELIRSTHCADQPDGQQNSDTVDYSQENSDTIKRRETAQRHISQYYELKSSQSRETYAIGFKKLDPEVSQNGLKQDIERSLSIEKCREENTNQSPGSQQNIYLISKEFCTAKRRSFHLFRAFLKSVRFIAQLSVVPLLMVQMFDTYTLLCLAESDTCDRISQYRLHLAQTALSFSFYVSLMISLLTTLWLNTVPRPKRYSLNTPTLNLEPLHASS